MNRLRGFRLRAGMTQAELARAIGTTQSHVSEYESGARRIETMPAGEFVRLKAVLDVTDALLLDADLSGIDPDAIATAENRVAQQAGQCGWPPRPLNAFTAARPRCASGRTSRPTRRMRSPRRCGPGTRPCTGPR